MIEINERFPIVYIPMFRDEARALGAEISYENITNAILVKIKRKELQEPVWLTGSSEAVCDMLKEAGIDAREIRRTFIRL